MEVLRYRSSAIPASSSGRGSTITCLYVSSPVGRASAQYSAAGGPPQRLGRGVLLSSLLGTRLKSASPASAAERRRAVGFVVTAGIFEKFTEKAIKAVMLAQTFASRMQSAEVGAQWGVT